MVNTHDAIVARLIAFIRERAPAGAERDIKYIRPESCFFNLEFERNGEFRASCMLYIEIHGSYETKLDDVGRWSKRSLTARPSWPSYGSMTVAEAQGRLALMAEVTRFAADMEREFAGEWDHLVETAEEYNARMRRGVEQRVRHAVENAVFANAKGLRVGQERFVPGTLVSGGLEPIGEVTLSTPSGRKYTAHVTSTEGFFFTRTV